MYDEIEETIEQLRTLLIKVSLLEDIEYNAFYSTSRTGTIADSIITAVQQLGLLQEELVTLYDNIM